MSHEILLSIKPKFANAIFSGKKIYEFRKSCPKNRNLKKVYVYASAPVSRVIGCFSIADIFEMELSKLWKKTREGAGITEEYFQEYFSGRKTGYAIQVRDVNRYEDEKCLASLFGIAHPPQSFRYVRSTSKPLHWETEYRK